MQGWSPDFVPKITGDVIDMNVIDKLITIAGPNAMKCARELATKEGIFVGISAGATLAGGLEVCQEAADGANILCMPPDTGERYLSTPVFAEIETDMNDKEREISRLTPGFYLQAAG
jgi:cysteine synthase A